MINRAMIGAALELALVVVMSARDAGAAEVVLDNTNGYVATIEPGATIGHRGTGGSGPLVLVGMELAFAPAADAVFPTGITQVGDGGGRPRDLIGKSATFSLRGDATGILYEGFMTWWGSAGDDFDSPDGIEPIPGNPNLASAAFKIWPVARVDSDDDGLFDGWELCHGLNPDDPDSDGDMIPDGEEDEDMDGLDHLGEQNAGTDPSDPDSDSDSLPDGAETRTMTWQSIADTGTSPTNDDSDGDGLKDGVENPDLPFVDENQTGSDPNIVDTDGDTLPDNIEVAIGLNPNDPLDSDGDEDSDGSLNGAELVNGTGVTDPDSDDDGLQDGVETNTGVFASSADTGTDPLDPDSDDDGLNDGVETNTGVFIGATNTGTDPHDVDSDGDLFNDFFEVERGFDPHDPTSRPPVPPDAILFENFEGFSADGLSPNSNFALSSSGVAPPWVVDVGGPNFSVLRITDLAPDSINSAAWDAVDLPAEFEFSFVFRMSDDAANPGCCGEAADGFGFGFFDTTIYGESGPNNPGVGAQWEDPTAAAGFPGGLFFGFDIFQANNVRVTGMGGPADVIRDDPFPFTINDNVFHGVRVSIAGSGEDTVLSLVMIEDILGVSTEHAVFSEVVVAGLDLSAVRTRLIMGGRTGSAVVQTDLDCILISGSAGPFQVTEVLHDEDAGVLTVTWPSREGSEYTVDSSTDMADPDTWNELDDAVPGARGSNRTSFDVPIPDGATQIFVRVRESR